ncbi:hypothetical protein ACB092_03G051100 [Castanea dentata]
MRFSVLAKRIFRCFTKENGSLKVTEVNGADVGVAFFLHFSVHTLKTDHSIRNFPICSEKHLSLKVSPMIPGMKQLNKLRESSKFLPMLSSSS